MAPRNTKEKKDISSKELLTLDTKVNEKMGTVVRMRVVDWNIDGKHYPQLEKREFYTDQDGQEKMGKAKGMSAKDLAIVRDNWDEIMGALGGEIGAPADKPALADPVLSHVAAPEQEF